MNEWGWFWNRRVGCFKKEDTVHQSTVEWKKLGLPEYQLKLNNENPTYANFLKVMLPFSRYF